MENEKIQQIMQRENEEVSITLRRKDWRVMEDILRKQSHRDANTRNYRNRGRALGRLSDLIMQTVRAS